MYDLLAGMTSDPSAAVDAIICFDKFPRDNRCYNLRILRELLPLLVVTPNMRAHYYHSHARALFRELAFLPYLVLTDSAALSFTADGSEGILFRDGGMLEFLQEFFARRLSHTAEVYSPVLLPLPRGRTVPSCFTPAAISSLVSSGKLTLSRAGALAPHILDTERIGFSGEATIYAPSPQAICLYLKTPSRELRLTLSEPSIVRAFYTFLEHLDSLELLLEPATAAETLAKITDKY